MSQGQGGGRPRKYNTTGELESAIKYYFDSITKTYQVFDSKIIGYEDAEKKQPIYEKIPRLNNAGEPIFDDEYLEIPNITGCCIHMGIVKDTWNEYSRNEKFSDPIMRAKEKIEQYNIKQLYRKEQVNGIMFNLKNNYGWTDKQEITNTNLNIDSTTLSQEDRDKRIQELKAKLMQD